MITLDGIQQALENMREVVRKTPMYKDDYLSRKYHANVYLKREDIQVVRSYKIRGAYNKMSSLSPEKSKRGVVCASSGNHAQGVALSCKLLQIKGYIYMPENTPLQKVNQVKWLGEDYVEIKLVGKTFDQACHEADKRCIDEASTFIHAFDDYKIIEGQGTVALEVIEDFAPQEQIDYLFIPVGGGGLSAGMASVFSKQSPKTRMIGAEPENAAGMIASIQADRVVTLSDDMDTFVDGAAIQKIGSRTFPICKKELERILEIPKGMICSQILEMYELQGIVTEPAGTLSICALEYYREEIRGKNVVCVVSGGNNDLTRIDQIKRIALQYKNLLHAFVIKVPKKKNALQTLLQEVFGDTDEVRRGKQVRSLEYIRRQGKSYNHLLVCVELEDECELETLVNSLNKLGYDYEKAKEGRLLFNYLF